MTKRLFLLGFLLALAGTQAQVWAARSAHLNKEQVKAVHQVSQYFSAIKTIQGKFSQIGPRGNVSTGVFFISKPGKMRFEYAAPNPFLVVADGTWVTVKNRKRNKADQYPLSSTPLRLILENRVNLLKQAIVRSVEQSDGIATIRLEDTNKFVSGSLILVFDQQKNNLRQWIVVDDRGRQTAVSFNDVKHDVKPDPKLFFVKIPKRERMSDK